VSLGIERISDLVVNCLLPVVLLYARLFKDQVIREKAYNMLESFSPLQQNSITRLLERQLLKEKLRLGSALEQQGAIHLFKFFCLPGRCSECEIGMRLRIGDRE